MQPKETNQSLPGNPDVERTILGAICLDNRTPNGCFMQAQQRITLDDFSLDSHKRIFRAMESLAAAKKPIEYTTLCDQLLASKEIESVGGVAYVTSLADQSYAIRLANIENYLEILIRVSSQRKIVLACTSAITQAYESEQPGEILGGLQENIDVITERNQGDACVHVSQLIDPLSEELVRRYEDAKDFIGLPTGIGRLNWALGGLVKGENIVVAGDTGGGKTAFALNVAEINCRKDNPVQFFSFELSKEELVLRLAAKRAGVSQIKLRNTRSMELNDMQLIIAEMQEIRRWPLWIDDSAGIGPREFYARGRMQAAKGSKLFVVDYLQKLAARAPGQTTREQVNTASEAIRSLAKDTAVPVLNLSQLARFEKAAQMRKPTMHDLKESGNIEQDAHVVLLLWRAMEKQNNKFTYTGEDSLIIGKNRNGPTMEIPVYYEGALMHWRERETEVADYKTEAAGVA